MDIYVHGTSIWEPELAEVKRPDHIQAFGLHLRALREQRQWSQQELADRADVTKKTIYRIETAQSVPTLDVLICLAEGLEIPLPHLVTFHS